MKNTIDPRQVELFLSKPGVVSRLGPSQLQAMGQYAATERGKTKWVGEGNTYLPSTQDYISKGEWTKLTPDEKREVRQKGVSAFNRFRQENVKLATGEWYPRSTFEKLSVPEQSFIYQEGLTAKSSSRFKVLDCIVDGLTSYEDITRITGLNRSQIDNAVEKLKRGGYLT